MHLGCRTERVLCLLQTTLLWKSSGQTCQPHSSSEHHQPPNTIRCPSKARCPWWL